jgi:hypothetical protein
VTLTYVDDDRVSSDDPNTFFEVGSLLVKAGDLSIHKLQILDQQTSKDKTI